ncbi:MAG: hypothetical protein WAT41_13365, partial [Flavobacteriales bacterium]
YLAIEGKNMLLLEQIRECIEKSKILRNELEEESGGQKINIRKYSKMPFGQLKLIDGNTENGRILGYHYLTLDMRPGLPYFEIWKKVNPILYSSYKDATEQIIQSSSEF